MFVDLIVKVAHGPTLSSFVSRWLNYPIDFPLSAMLEPGGIGILRYTQNFRPPDIVHVLRYNSYQHHTIDEPAFMLGIALP